MVRVAEAFLNQDRIEPGANFDMEKLFCIILRILSNLYWDRFASSVYARAKQSHIYIQSNIDCGAHSTCHCSAVAVVIIIFFSFLGAHPYWHWI